MNTLVKRHSASAKSHMLYAISLSVLCMVLAISLSTFAAAQVDLLTPSDQMAQSNTTVTFEYYASMPGMVGCSVHLNDQTMVDVDAQSNAMNDVQVQNLPPGLYSWNISCTNGTGNPGDLVDFSATRTFTIDTQAPSLVIISPQNGTAKTISLSIIPNDETATQLACTALWSNTTLDTMQVARNTYYSKNYTANAGNGSLVVSCQDAAGNTVTQSRSLMLLPDFGLSLRVDKQEYGLGERPQLTIETIPGANVSIDICPNQPGFVQCTTALIDNSVFPQTVNLPVMNKTGPYLVEGIVTFMGQTRVNSTNYTIINTIGASISSNMRPQTNRTFELTANIDGGIPPYRFSWLLHNGTRLNDVSTVAITHDTPGNFTQTLTVYDQGNNTRTTNYTYIVQPMLNLIIQVVDNQTNEPITDADVSVNVASGGNEQRTRTMIGGLAYASVLPGTYRIFTSQAGYQYSIGDYVVANSQTIMVRLARNAALPQVSLSAPIANSTVAPLSVVSFLVQHEQPVLCTLYIGNDGWFAVNATMTVSDTAMHAFSMNFSEGRHAARIECTDSQGKTGASSTTSFVVAAESGVLSANSAGTDGGLGAADIAGTASSAPTKEELVLQNAVVSLDESLQSIDAYGPKEKEAIALLGFDKNLRNAKRAVQQAIRDMSNLQFRSDLDAAGKTAERARIMANVNSLLSLAPRSITVTDTKMFVRYLKDTELPKVAKELAGLDGFSQDGDALSKRLLPDQQKFTISTRVYTVDYKYQDQSVKSVTIVTRSFTYAQNLSSEYHIYEIIPKEVSKTAKELTIISAGEIVKDDPVLRFDTGESITYVVPRRVDLSRMEDIKTVLARPYAAESNLLTGFAIFDGEGITSMNAPLIALIAFIVLVYLIYYFDLIKQVKFLVYRFGKNEKTHYVRVMINDAIDQLDADNYDKAEMLYKEVRLSYDGLPVPGRNELYDDIIELVRRMDVFYFNMVMIELDGHLKMDQLEQAIASYEKLTKIYERLEVDKQEQLIATVSALGKRIGLVANPAVLPSTTPAAAQAMQTGQLAQDGQATRVAQVVTSSQASEVRS